MPDLSDLSRAFLINRPGDSARALEAVSRDDAAAFLSTCPAPVVAPLLNTMRGTAAAEILRRMPDSLTTQTLAELSAGDVAWILRNAGQDGREALIALLSKHRAAEVSRILRYSRDQVGAWCTTGVFAVPPDLSVAEGLDRIRAGASPVQDLIFLTGEDREYLGAVMLAAMVRAKPDQVLRGLVLGDLAPLYDKSTLASVASLDVWAVHNLVPVVDRRDRLVGALSEKTLHQALGEKPADRPDEDRGGLHLVLSLTDAYTRTLSGALELLFTRWRPLDRNQAAQPPARRQPKS